MPLPPGTVAYSLEALDLASRLAARGRYQLPPPPTGLNLSDVVIIRASELPPPASRKEAAFQPLAALMIPRGEAIALYLEVQGLTVDANRQVNYRVELEVLEQSKGGAFTGVVRRLGRALGMGNDDVAPRIIWNQQQDARTTTVVALRLGQIDLEPGLKRFRITLTDTKKGTSATTERMIRVKASDQAR
jgi:hypothetical protein